MSLAVKSQLNCWESFFWAREKVARIWPPATDWDLISSSSTTILKHNILLFQFINITICVLNLNVFLAVFEYSLQFIIWYVYFTNYTKFVLFPLSVMIKLVVKCHLYWHWNMSGYLLFLLQLGVSRICCLRHALMNTWTCDIQPQDTSPHH